MKKTHLSLMAAGMVLVGLLLLVFGSQRPVTILIDGEAQTLQTRAMTAAQAMNEAGLAIGPGDRVSQPPESLLAWNGPLVIERASQVQVWSDDQTLSPPTLTMEQTAGNILAENDVLLYPGDRIFLDGESIEAETELEPGETYLLQVQPALPLTLEEDGEPQTLYSADSTVSGALWSAGVRISTVDSLSSPAGEALDEDASISLARAQPVSIEMGEREITINTSAERVGEVLAEAGISLQNLDYSLPPEDETLPEDRAIRVVRVREEVILEQTAEPFETEYVPDPETELDQRSIIEPGQYGVRVSRLRVRYEDDQEVAREQEAEWIASEPKKQVAGYGTKVVVRTLDTPSGPIEYWRSITVYATSYSPCRLGVVGRCNSITASGQTLTTGMVAVSRAWFSWMRGQGLYIPGYGHAVVADTGGGIPGQHWIDLGYTDDDYQSWHSNVTVYFLTPVPPTIPWILP
jgi:resuscitation-promoting factor RpfB